MAYLFQIPNAMLNSMWMMSILFLLYLSIQFVFKLKAARSFILAVAFECIAALYFIYSVFNPGNTSFKVTTLSFTSNPIWTNYYSYIGILYCLALLLYLIYIIVEFKQLIHLRNTADFQTNGYWKKLVANFGENEFIIGQSKDLKAPITFGWIDAVILLPISILNHLSTEEVKFILLHEIGHIIRNDFIIQLIVNGCHFILIFNPFSYFFTKEINILRELACDEWVIHQTSNPVAYSKTLYQLALITQSANNPLLLNAVGTEKELLTRIKHLHQLPVKSTSVVKKGLFALLVLIVTSIGVNTSMQSKNIITAHQEINQPVKSIVKHLSAKHLKHHNAKNAQVVIIKLKSNNIASAPIKDEMYNAVVSKAVNWIKVREDQYNYVNYSKARDSIEFEMAEKLLLRSVLQNYQLRKELLNAKLANIESEKEAMDFLENSKEWHEVLQYENWASTFMKRHPELAKTDSLRRF